MGHWARRLIDGANNTLLPPLVGRLWFPVFFTLDGVEQNFLGWGRTGFDWSGTFLTVGLAGLFVVWVFGYLARRPKSGLAPLERLQVEHSNSFEVWLDEPEGGLRPSRFMRGVVGALGRMPGTRPSIVEMLVVFTSFAALLWVLLPASWVERFVPLPTRDAKAVMMVTWCVVISTVAIRQWASEQRVRLAALGQPG